MLCIYIYIYIYIYQLIHVSIYLGARSILQRTIYIYIYIHTHTHTHPGAVQIPAEMIQAGGKTVP